MADMDTAAKRFSAVNLDLPFGRLLPIPDGVISVADQQSLLGKYAGITFVMVLVTTAARRYSLINLDLPFGRLLIIPDGSISALDRQAMLGKYVGIAFFSTGGSGLPPMMPIHVWTP